MASFTARGVMYYSRSLQHKENAGREECCPVFVYAPSALTATDRVV